MPILVLPLLPPSLILWLALSPQARWIAADFIGLHRTSSSRSGAGSANHRF
jgi:hypothetical protein